MLRVSSRTDPGKKRVHNEDALLALPEVGLFVVADGVGGRAAGEVASASCIEAFRSSALVLRERAQGYLANASTWSRNAVLAALDDTCQQASRRVYEQAEAEGKNGMTTTMVAVLLAGTTAFVAHVGDSRAYIARTKELKQLTEDHSMVNELVRAGKMTPAEARTSKHRHVITRAIGLYPTVQPSLGSIDLLPGDRLLLCSDGLSDVVGPTTLQTLALSGETEACAEALLQAALDAGGPDNVTVLLVDPEGRGVTDEANMRARVLENLFLFEDMPFANRLQVARILREHWFAPGETLVTEATPGDAMYVILDGEVTVKSGAVELAKLGSGDHFGELSLVDMPRSATVVANSFGSAISLRRQDLVEFCNHEPELGTALLWKLLWVLGKRLTETNARAQPTTA
jgi:serine/threonine protein phosphatase PrpC